MKNQSSENKLVITEEFIFDQNKLSKDPNNHFNAGQKYCRMFQGELSAILSTFIKLPFVIKIVVLSIFERPGFFYCTVLLDYPWIHIDTISMELSILYFKGLPVIFSNKMVYFCP